MTLCLLLALPAQAASWEWSSRSGRERLEVRLDAGMREQATARTGPTSVDIRFNAATDGVAGQSRPAPGSLITAIDPVGDTLRLTLRDAAFGYIVQRGAGSVSVEVFADPFGARWQPSDARVLPPLPSVTPPAPTQTATQTMGQTMGQTAPPAQAATRLPSAQVSQGQSDQAVLSPLPSVSPVPPVSPVPAVPSGQAIQAQSGATGTPGAQAQPPVAGVQSGAASAAVVPGVAAQSAAVGPGGAPQSGAPGQTGTAHVPAAQGQLPQGQTQGGGTTLFQVNVGSPGQAAPTANGGLQTTMQGAPAGTAGGGVAVSVNMTPAGMPGAAASGPIAVASGSALPAQVDPPDATAPSNAVLDAITRKIESLPAQVEVAPPVSSLDEALLSTPVAPAVQPAAPGSTQTQAPAEHTTPPAGNGANGKTPHVSVTVAESARGAEPQTPQAASPAGNAANGVLRTPVTVSGPDRSVATQAASQPQGRLVSGGGDGLRARFNTGGPDAWPVADGLSTTVSDEAASDSTVHMQVQSSAPAGAHGDGGHGEAKKAEPEVIYVDEDGKPVPKPLDVNGALAEARTLIQSLQFEPARDLLVQLKEAIMPPEKREEMLYLLSDAITGMYNGKWLEGYEPIVASTSEAMNANLSSPQVPRALERLGMINLRTGNQQDAAGYFGALRNKYPMDSQVPECYYALGMEQLANGQYAEAVQNFQLVMQEYPESQVVRLASRFMAEALYKQGHYERTMTIVDFVDRRWPRIYLEDPDYLLMVADTQFRRGRLDDALQTYWAYYNLMPSAPGNDQLMLNVGTIYMMQGEMKSARTMYSELLKRYPDSQYAPLAVLRQGEEGIFEGNLSIDDLFAMFSRPNLTTVPEAAYRHLLQDYPGAGESVTAALRLAAWRLWNKEYSEAMNEAESFIRNHPDSLYAPRADEIILRAFAVDLAMDLEEENYERILQRWERFPQIRGVYTPLSDDLRIALARAHLNRGNEEEGFALFQPFLDRPQDPTYGEYVYKLQLAKVLRTEDWQGILDLGSRVENWKLPEDERNQLVYAMAIARENLNQGQEAVPLWGKLYQRDDIPLYQKAYATYFMARDAERRRNIEDAYQLNKDTLTLFTRLGVENPERADSVRILESLVALMDVTEVANRFAEALEWAEQYEPFAPESSPDYAAFRFRLARLHRKMGDLARWQYMLEDITQREPDSVFGRMAASELRTQAVARDLSRFQPTGASAAAGGANP